MNHGYAYEAMDRSCMVLHHLQAALDNHCALYDYPELLPAYKEAHDALFALYQKAATNYFDLKEKEGE